MLSVQALQALKIALNSAASSAIAAQEMSSTDLNEVFARLDPKLSAHAFPGFSIEQVGILSFSGERISQPDALLCQRAIVESARTAMNLDGKHLENLKLATGQFIGQVNAMPPVAGEWHSKLSDLGAVVYSSTSHSDFSKGTFSLLLSTSLAYHASGYPEIALEIQEGLAKLLDKNPGVVSESDVLTFKRDYARALVAAGRFGDGERTALESLAAAEQQKDGPSYVILLRAAASAAAAEGHIERAVSLLSARPEWTRPEMVSSFNPLELDFELEFATLRFANGHSARGSLTKLIAEQQEVSIAMNAPNYTSSRAKLLALCDSNTRDGQLAIELLKRLIFG